MVNDFRHDDRARFVSKLTIAALFEGAFSYEAERAPSGDFVGEF
jgi:hypothetical protein